MPYVIETYDKPDHQHLRQATRTEHLAYLAENKNKLLACGAKLSDDGGDGGGSLYIVDTEDRAEAEALIDGDPFTKVGLFERRTITRWRKAYLDKVSYLP
jgi:uncharacterized protein